MTKSFAIQNVALASALMLAGNAWSHIVLEQRSAPAGSGYKAVFKVGHGCAGEATQGIRVLLPAGFQGAKPMPKPGWTLAVRSEKLAAPYRSHGREVVQDVTEISWTAATAQDALPDAHYDEFVLHGTLPAQPGPIWFKVLQRCATAQNDWSQVPAEGASAQGLASPAVLLQLTPVAPAAAAHH